MELLQNNNFKLSALYSQERNLIEFNSSNCNLFLDELFT